ncbi:unnamed protein product [Effrenium voratum]|uniref:Uncharacterized protein n=1 Tax=Effrenium voratum TaxID=2562239 RepID=A0AA36J879_9DINO|nr:unnamed protein product [Effrenium voratum]CAJ1449060.1 unnamed protein product [Effrenium voratum]
MALRTQRKMRSLAGILMALFALNALCFVSGRSPGPAPDRDLRSASHAVAEAEEMSKPAQDDGRVLDTSNPVGFVGALVVSLAVLPYLVLSIYSAVQLATTGQAFLPILEKNALSPSGVLGLGEGVGVVVTFGVVLWSALSVVLRFRGLPEGPFGVLGLTQTLSYVAAVIFAIGAFLNGLGEDNPVKGLELAKLNSGKQLEQVASKGGKLLSRAEQEVAKITAEPRAELEAKLKEVEEKAGVDVKLPDIKLPDVKLPDVTLPKMPDVKLPEVKTPDVKVPEFKMPAFKMPELKLPKAGPASAPAPAVTEAAPPASSVTPTPKAAEGDLFD